MPKINKYKNIKIKKSVLEHSDEFYRVLRPEPLVSPKTNLIVSLLIFFATLTVYWMTQNRSVTFWDVGEYIACSSILGVPHPPGNPFYIVLGRFFTILGLGTPHAFVMNAVSGLLSSLAVVFTYLLTVKLVTMIEANKTLIITAGIIAALYNAFSFTFWNNAIETSVYPARDLVINMTMYLTLLWVEKARNFSHQNILMLIIYIFFLGFSIHQTALQTVPAVLFVVLYPVLLDSIKTNKFWLRFFLYLAASLIIYFIFIEVGKQYNIPDMAKIATGIFLFVITYIHFRDRVETKAWLLGIALIVIALSPHLFLLVRSQLRPFINEGDPRNLEMFTDYVLRRQYGVISFMERRATAWYQFTHHFLRYFFWQFFHAETLSGWTKLPAGFFAALSRILVLFLGFFGMYHQAKKNKHSFVYLLAFFFMTCFAMIFVMNLSDAEVRDRDYFFVSAYYLWGVWMAIGSIGLIRLIADNRKRLVKPLLVIFLALPVINFSSQYFIHDRSREFIALDYGLNFLNSVEENAIIFTNGDNDTFPLWYAQAVFDPFKDGMENIYEAKDVYPEPEVKEFIQNAVERKREELSGIRPDVTVANLSLLNTPWYIRHLRDIEGVKFDIPDEQIDNMRPMRSDRAIPVNISCPRNEQRFTVTVPARKVMLVKDTAALRIIRDNFGRRPIYMAVTVADEIVFQEHLRNEGMVNRIVPERGENQLDIERLKNNVNNVYSYRSIFEDDIYKDENMLNLITNYGAAMMRISQHFHRRGDANKAAEYLARAVKFIRDKERFYPSIVEQFVQAENYEQALVYIEKVLEHNPHEVRMYFEAVNIHMQDRNAEKVYAVFQRAVDNRVSSPELAQFLFSITRSFEEYDRGIELLQEMSQYDDDRRIDEYIQRIRMDKESARQDSL